MTVARPSRRRALALGLGLCLALTLGTFASSRSWAGAPGAPCLSKRVGDVLSAKLAAHAFDGVLPPGWTLEEVAIHGDRIDLGALDGDRRPRGVSLRLGEPGAEAVAGRGRSFVFVLDRGAEPLDNADRRALIDLATRVDAAVPEDEARSLCSARLDGAPTWLRMGAGFYALVVAGVLAAAWRCRRSMRSGEAVLPVLLTLVGLGLRFAAHAGIADIRQVLGAGLDHGFAPRAGWSSWLRLLFTVMPPRYESVWAVHRVLGAMAVPLLYVALRQRFSPRSVAAAGAASLAVLPLAVRFSASDTPYVPLCTAMLGAVVALTQFRRSGSRGALALGLLLLTAAMHLRPDGPWLVVPVAVLVLTVPAGASRPRGRAVSLTTLAAVTVFAAVNAVPVVWALAGHNRVGDGSLGAYARTSFVLVGTLVGSPWTHVSMSPWPLSLLVLGGALLAPRAGRPAVGWLAATLVAMPLKFPAAEQYANARYHLPAMVLACGLAGLAASFVIERVPRRGAAARIDPAALSAALALLAAVPRLDLLTRMWTPQLEFEFYRAGLRGIAADCTVVAFMGGQDAGFVPFSDPDVATPTDIATYLRDPPPPGAPPALRSTRTRRAATWSSAWRSSRSWRPACPRGLTGASATPSTRFPSDSTASWGRLAPEPRSSVGDGRASRGAARPGGESGRGRAPVTSVRRGRTRACASIMPVRRGCTRLRSPVAPLRCRRPRPCPRHWHVPAVHVCPGAQSEG